MTTLNDNRRVFRSEILENLNSQRMLEKVKKLAVLGRHNGGHLWYRDGLADLTGMVENLSGYDVDDMAFLLACYSPRVSVSRACRLAVMHWHDDSVKPSGAMSQIYATALKYRDRGFLNGKKTEAFRQAIVSGGKTDDDSALCLDVHMAKVLEIDQKYLYQIWNHPTVLALFRRAQFEMIENYSLAEFQAAVWCGYILELGHSVLKRDLVPAELKGSK